MDWVTSCFAGALRGIVILWDTRVVQLVRMEESCYTLSCRFRNCANYLSWIFMGIYGPTKRVFREGLWEDMGAIRGVWGDPWCLGVDFNVLGFLEERNREGRWMVAMRRFSQVIDDLELKDQPLLRGDFTRVGGPGNQRMARLDRFLVSDDWENYFRIVNQKNFP